MFYQVNFNIVKYGKNCQNSSVYITSHISEVMLILIKLFIYGEGEMYSQHEQTTFSLCHVSYYLIVEIENM